MVWVIPYDIQIKPGIIVNVKGVVIQKVTGHHAGQAARQTYFDSCVRYDNEWCRDVCTPYADGFSKHDDSDFIIFKMAKDNVKYIVFKQKHLRLDDIQIFYTGKSLECHYFASW